MSPTVKNKRPSSTAPDATSGSSSTAASFLNKQRQRVEALRPKVKVLSLPNQIHDVLEDAIIHGDIEPGARIRADDVATEFGISRIPVREALSSLHEAGWVEIRPRYGVYVRGRSRTELKQLFEARAGIDSEIASWAASRRNEEDVTALGRIVNRSRSAAENDDVEALFLASNDFYAALRNAARNEVMSAISLNLEKRARFYFYPIARQLGRDWATRQSTLVDLIIAGDSVRSAEATRGHMIATGADVLRLLEFDAAADVDVE